MIADFYKNTAYVVTVTKPDDFSTSAITESLTTVKCAINPVSGHERFAGGKNDVFVDYKLYCSAGVVINEQKRIRWNGADYNVVFVRDPFIMGHHKTIYLAKDVR